MQGNALKCPRCRASIPIQAGAVPANCPYCGAPITAVSGETDKAMKDGTIFYDDRTGIPIGSAVIPEGWTVSGTYRDIQIDEITPFGTILDATNPQKTIRMTSQYGEHHYDYVSKSAASMLMQGISRKAYLDPKNYLMEYAARVLKIKMQPKTYGRVRTRYSQNRAAEAQKFIARFNENAKISLPSIQCDYRLQNALCESVAMSGRFRTETAEYSMIVAADLFGLEYYDAAKTVVNEQSAGTPSGETEQPGAGAASLGNILSESIRAIRSGAEEGINSPGFCKKSELAGVMKRQKERLEQDEAARDRNRAFASSGGAKSAVTKNGSPVFGHTVETGKPVDTIEWGAKRFYYAVGPAEQEAYLIENFMTFIGSYRQDDALEQRLEQYHQQVRMQEQTTLQNASNYAMKARTANTQRPNRNPLNPADPRRAAQGQPVPQDMQEEIASKQSARSTISVEEQLKAQAVQPPVFSKQPSGSTVSVEEQLKAQSVQPPVFSKQPAGSAISAKEQLMTQAGEEPVLRNLPKTDLFSKQEPGTAKEMLDQLLMKQPVAGNTPAKGLHSQQEEKETLYEKPYSNPPRGALSGMQERMANRRTDTDLFSADRNDAGATGGLSNEAIARLGLVELKRN